MMGRKSRRTELLTVLFAAAVLMLQAPAKAEVKPFEQVVPEDILNFVSIPDYRASAERLKKTPYNAMLSDPELRQLVDEIADSAAEGLSQFKEATGVALSDVEKLLSGEIAMAMMPPDAFGEQGKMLILADVSADPAEAERILAQALQRAVEGGTIQLAEEQIRGHNIRVVSLDVVAGLEGKDLEDLDPELREMLEEMGDEPAGGAGAQTVLISLEDGILAVQAGGDRALLERHLLLRDGGDVPALSGNQRYRDLKARLGTQGDYFNFQNLDAMWETMRGAGQDAGMFMPFDPMQLIEAMGIFGIQATVSQASIEEDGIEAQSFTLIPAPRNGILKAFVPQGAASVKPPAFVGEDAAVYLGAYCDVPVLWEEIKIAIGAVAPSMRDMLQMRMENPQAPFHPERDLINTLGSHWFVYVPQEVVNPNPPGELNILIAAELKDAATLETTLGTLWTMVPPDAGATTAPFMGKTIYETGPLPMGPFGAGVSLNFAFVVVDGRLIIATSPAMAKLAVREGKREDSPLLGKPEFRGLLPHMISKPEWFAYFDARHIGKWAWQLAEMVAMRKGIALPAFDVLEKYLYVGVSTTKWNQDGVDSRFWMPYPPAE